jgi:DNA repair protein RadA/Sms
LGGDPGVGKSTLAAQIALLLSKDATTVCYISGEESAEQVGDRVQRLGSPTKHLQFMAERDIDTIIATIVERRPQMVILDSIQTLLSSAANGEAGSVQQVRLVTNMVMQAAKSLNIPMMIIGHVTKDGAMAGPKSLEHLVDTVLYLEGDPLEDVRLLRSVKNRFGTTQTVGVLRFTETGFTSVDDASKLFLRHRQAAPGVMATVVLEGRRPFAIEVQALTSTTSFGMPRRTASGTDPNRLHVLLAVLQRRAGLTSLGNQDVFVNVVGGMKAYDRGVDFGVCLAIVSSLDDREWPIQWIAIGEVGLGGEIRTPQQLEARLREAQLAGFTDAIIPKLAKKPKIAGLRFHEVDRISEAITLLQQAATRGASRPDSSIARPS